MSRYIARNPVAVSGSDYRPGDSFSADDHEIPDGAIESGAIEPLAERAAYNDIPAPKATDKSRKKS